MELLDKLEILSVDLKAIAQNDYGRAYKAAEAMTEAHERIRQLDQECEGWEASFNAQVYLNEQLEQLCRDLWEELQVYTTVPTIHNSRYANRIQALGLLEEE